MGDAKSYANCLLKLVENINTPRSTLVVPIAAITRKQVSVRIEEIRKRRMVMPDVRLSRVAFLSAISLSVLGVITALKAPPVIAIARQSSAVSNQVTETSPESSHDTSVIDPVQVATSKQTTRSEAATPDTVGDALNSSSPQQSNSGSEKRSTTNPNVDVVSYPQSWDPNLARSKETSQRGN